MRATLARTARVPMIHFLGKRSLPTTPHIPAAHPAAPKEIADAFSAFAAKAYPGGIPKPRTFRASRPAIPLYKESSKPADFNNYWEAPAYYWTKSELTEREVEAIMSGGATDIRTGA